MKSVFGISTVVVAMSSTTTFAQAWAGWMAVLPIAALAIYGWFHGAFLAVIAGLQVLFSFVFALTWSRPMALGLETIGCPPAWSLAVAFWMLVAVGITATRIAVGSYVPEGVVRFEKLLDHCIGAGLGAVAGGVLGGALLIGWSLTNGPAWMRFDPENLPFDGGRRMLWTFARWTTSSEEAAGNLVNGDPMATSGEVAKLVRASEPFVDSDGDDVPDAVVDKASGGVAQRYLDLDGNREFTTDLAFVDYGEDGRRMIGLYDCYRLANWRHVRCLHPPRITSVDAIEVVEEGPIEEVIYTVTAEDVDPGDSITFDLKSLHDDVDVTIDPTTGIVTLLQPLDYETGKKKYVFEVGAKDSAGLEAERKKVTVGVRDKPD
ncbi:MAG: cadherin repeat domain-containing protein [Solirubrobacterales bacterium]